MIIGIGTDIIEVERVRRAIENAHFVERVFTAKEIKYCYINLRKDKQLWMQNYKRKEVW